MKYDHYSRNYALALIIIATAAMSSTVWATKVWVENKTEKPLAIKFSGAGIIPSIEKDKTKFGDNIGGLNLTWFSINKHEIKVPAKLQKGRFWYVYVEQKPFELAKFTLYRINPSEVNFMHGATLAARIIDDIVSLGLFEALWQSFLHEDIKSAAEKALTCVMTGIVDKQGVIHFKYDEKFIVNVAGMPVTAHIRTRNNQTFDQEIPDQNGQFFDTLQPMTDITLETPPYGKFAITGTMLKNEKYFAILNNNPYQIATFSNKDLPSIDLFDAIEKKLEKFIKTNPAIESAMSIKYFINNTPNPIDVEMEVADHKTQKITIAAQGVDILAAPAKITSFTLNDGITSINPDVAMIEKYSGFYITDLKNKKDGILYISTEAKDFKFPVKLSATLWWQGSLACENIGE